MFKRLFPVLFETPTDGGGAPPGSVDPPPALHAVPDLPPTPPPAAAPWAADLEAIIPDAASRQAADEYLRTKWQPRMTQFEQQVQQAAPALALVEDFRNDPAATFQAVAAEIWEDDPEQLAKVTAAFAAGADPTAPPAASPPPRDPEVEEMLAEYQNTQREKAYSDSIAALQAANPTDTTINGKSLAPFVVSAQGDFNAAYAGYQAYVAELRTTTGLTPAEAATFQAPPPPAVLGSAAVPGGGPTPPVAVRHNSLDSALDETLKEMREARNPTAQPVGTV